MKIELVIDNLEDIQYIDNYNGDINELLQTAVTIGLKSINMSKVEMTGSSYFSPIQEIMEKYDMKHTVSMEYIITILDDLMNTKQNSSRKGKLGEFLAINTLIKKYPNMEVINTSGTDHEGDCCMKCNYGKILYEFKTYTTNVNKEEINKFKKDIKTTNSNYGIFISHTSGIIDKRPIDIEVIDKTILIYISNSGLNGYGIEIGTELLFCLINADIINNKNIVLNDQHYEIINTMINDLYECITNFSRISSQIMESKQKVSSIFDNLYKQSLDYEIKGKTIINNINNELQYSIQNNNIQNIIDNTAIINTISDNKQQVLLSKLIDILDNFNIIISKSTDIELNIYNLYYNDKYIGKFIIKSKIELLISIIDNTHIVINSKYEKVKGNHISIYLSKNIDCWDIITNHITLFGS